MPRTAGPARRDRHAATACDLQAHHSLAAVDVGVPRRQCHTIRRLGALTTTYRATAAANGTFGIAPQGQRDRMRPQRRWPAPLSADVDCPRDQKRATASATAPARRDGVGGRCSLLFEHNAHSEMLQATSATGLDALPTEPWPPTASDAQILSDTFAPTPTCDIVDTERQLPALSVRPRHRLGAVASAPAGASGSAGDRHEWPVPDRARRRTSARPSSPRSNCFACAVRTESQRDLRLVLTSSPAPSGWR